MQRMRLAGVLTFLSVGLWLAVGERAYGQDRAGAAGMAAAAGQPPPGPPAGPPAGPPPGPGVLPPPRGGVIPPGGVAGGGGGGIVPPAAGSLGIGTIPVMPPTPPIGYYAPVRSVDYNMGKFFYYPFYYYPHSYWPTQSCQWPERPGQRYVRPPAYMTYPPFLEPHWRYEWYTPQRYYRGFHFWLDQF